MPKNQEKTKEKKEFRPPIVVILGHVDHGKTSILDYIRKTKVAEKEAGGITQHIGAYQVKHNDKLITFIDTPGHEAFSAMRSRGAKVADLAILVVAAEEGVRPQTKEAILHIKKAGLPMIIAINKIDRKEAQPEKVKGELGREEVFVESMGGKVPAVEVSAKTGQGINELLEMILLVSEVENIGQIEDSSLPSNLGGLSQRAEGVVIESYLDSQRGPAATFLVKKGRLKLRDIVSTETAFGAVRTIQDFRLKAIQEAGPSVPVLVTGLNQAPGVGEEWKVYNNLEEAKNKTERKSVKEKKRRESIELLDTSSGKKVLNLILRADVLGSLEAIRESIKIIPQEEVVLRILKAEAGEIGESDIKLAESAKAVIFGFRTKIHSVAASMAERAGVKILIYQVIYDLIQSVREELTFLLEPEIFRRMLSKAKVIAYFKASGNRQVIGARVTEGKIERGALIDVLRKGEKIGSGKLIQLQKNKLDIKEGVKDEECGILFEGQAKIEIGDILEAYREEKKMRSL